MGLVVPLELSFREVVHGADLEELVRKHVDRLQKFCDHIDSCRVAIERPHRHLGAGDEYRVRIDMRVAPGHEIVVSKSETEVSVQKVIRDAFHIAERRVKALNGKQRGQVKAHVAQEVRGIITKLLDGYGFIAAEGREIYFHEHSVVSDDFGDLRVGMGVAFSEEPGQDGPQASSVRVMDRRGARAPAPPA